MSIEHIIIALKNRKETEVAKSVLEAFARSSSIYEEYDDLAKSAYKIKEYSLAAKYGECALGVANSDEKLFVARSNLIKVYTTINQPEKAMTLIAENEAASPQDSDTQLEKSFAYFLMNEKSNAEKILITELGRDDIPQETKEKIRFNLGTHKMCRGEFLSGMSASILGGQSLGGKKPIKLSGEYWSGQPAVGRDILVVGEAGIGDEIINIRFCKNLKSMGMNPVWFTDRKDIGQVFENSGFNVIYSLNDRPKNSLWTTSMALPIYLNLDHTSLWESPYIFAEEKYVDKYKHLKGKIGIRWQGNPEYDQDLFRSIPLDQIVPIFTNKNKLVSLQRDTGLDELNKFPSILDLSESMSTFNETLGILANLDIVITSCTSIAHAAASMGKRTFIFVPIAAYYVWNHPSEQSPWYGSNVTILRQTHPRDWTVPINQLKNLMVK